MPAAWTDTLDHEPRKAFDQVMEHLELEGDLWSDCKLAAEGRPAWATFDDPDQPLSPAVRANAPLMLQQLAMLRDSRSVLVEIIYDASDAENIRFPTVADAGWERRFRSAPPGADWGLTAPEGLPPQPEVVHDNADLTIRRDRPRFLALTPF